MHRLHRQLLEQRLQALFGLASGCQQLRLARPVAEHWRQMSDQSRGMPWVPLQGALKPGMGETGQRLIDAGAEPAQLGDQLRFHILEPGQRLPLYVLE
ncbi:hypothetical protein D3C81_2120790 [compost metagenome]